jgi:FAD/FMN-containing dehydrogenase
VAVRFAREHDLPVSVRGGGHAVAGHAVVDGGLMIDLSAMRAVGVDPGARTARAAGGVLLGSWTGPPSGSGWPSPRGSSATPGSAG